MTEFQSGTKTINQDADKIYEMLSDLSNLDKIKDHLPSDKVKELEYDTDSFRAVVDPVGKIGFRIIDREPEKTIKFQSEDSPLELFLWIQLKQVADKDTRMRLTAKTELNMLLKGMLSKPIQEGIDKLADLLTKIPY